MRLCDPDPRSTASGEDMPQNGAKEGMALTDDGPIVGVIPRGGCPPCPSHVSMHLLVDDEKPQSSAQETVVVLAPGRQSDESGLITVSVDDHTGKMSLIPSSSSIVGMNAIDALNVWSEWETNLTR